MIRISDATATKSTDRFLVFDLNLLDALSFGQSLKLKLATEEITAKPSIDFANKNFEFSLDGGKSWQAADSGDDVTFGFGLTKLKVRLPVNKDAVLEGKASKTLKFRIADVLFGTVDDTTDSGTCTIINNEEELPVNITISNAIAVEGEDDFLVFDVELSSSSNETITLEMAVDELTAEPNDFVKELEVSTDGGSTWQQAVNDNQLTIPSSIGGITKVRLPINDDFVHEGSSPEIVSLRIANVLAGSVDDATALGLGVIVDNDSAQASGITYQAENAIFAGPAFFSGRGAEGTGYVDYQNLTQDFIEWTVNAPTTGLYNLSWRYANGSGNRPLALTINGNTEVSSLNFVGTNNWSTWDFVDRLATLNAGSNTVRLTAIGNSGANFDYLKVVNLSANSVTISDAIASEGINDFLVFDINLSSPSTEIITLDLAAQNKTAKGGLIADFGVGSIEDPMDYGNQEFEVSADGGTTWEAAVNGTEVTFLEGQTNLKVRLVVNDDEANEGLLPETMTLGVFDILAGTAIDATDSGTGSIVDNDGTSSSVIYQAENANFVGPAFFSGRGAEGTGYVDYQNSTGDFIEWTVNVPTATTYNLSWRYANGSSNRPLELAVNGEVEDPSLDFAGTGNWLNWDFVTQPVTLNAGSNTIRLTAIGISGANFDYLEVTNPSSNPISISPLPYTDVRIEGDLVFNFDGDDGGIVDKDNQEIGFTMVDPSSNPGNPNPTDGVVGYWPDKLDVSDGVLKLTTTPGIQYLDINSLDNALGIGLNVPSQPVSLQTTLVDLPTAPGGFAQAGLWFGKAEGGGAGSSEDNYIKLTVLSNAPGNYVLEALQEQDGIVVQKQQIDIPDTLESVSLNLIVNPFDQTIAAQYSLGDAPVQTLTTFTSVPEEWFSFDQAGIDPNIATRSFGGIFATHRKASSSQTFSFEDFSIEEGSDVIPPPSELAFDRWSIPVNNATSMELGPDGKLYVATLFGDIHVLTINPNTRTFTDEVIETIPNSEGGNRLTLGLAVDPDSTSDNVVLWVSHSSGSVNNGDLNSGKISRLSGSGFTQKEDIVVGLPRAIANHSTNDIDFGPDGRLYIWQGGNTGSGSANNEPTEFGNRPEQVLSAALLVADVKAPDFNGNAASNIGEFVEEFYARTNSDVQIYASGLRNTYDGVFHSNGKIYAPDNGLGVTGTVPPVPRLGDPSNRNITTLLGQVPQDNPGKQPDPLNLIVEGGYYGHPNPYRDEVVFKDGTFQGFDNTDDNPLNDIPPDHPDYQQPLFNLGENRSANGIVEYTANNFFGQLQGDLLISNFSQGDNITRVDLSSDGLSVTGASSLIDGFTDPLPIEMGPNGSFFVGEFNSGKITVLEPLGIWRTDLPNAPTEVLDAGSATLDDKLYMVGGKTAETHVNSLYIYDPGDPINAEDDTWTTGPNLPGAALENPAIAAFDGKIYSFGGSTAPFSGAVDNVAVFDPVESSWSLLPDMPTARSGATALVLDDKIYVVGGLDASGASVDTVEVYDPLLGQWSSESSLQTRRDNSGSAVIDDKLYVFGGRTRNSDGSVINGTLNTMEIYDPALDAWFFGEPMPTGRRAMSVGTVNNRIQVIGGEAGSGSTALSIQEEYNPATGSWRSLPGIPTPRQGASFGTIDNIIYVAAGGPTAGTAFTNVTEAFTF